MPIQHLPDAQCSRQTEYVAMETVGIELKMQLPVRLLAESELNEHLGRQAAGSAVSIRECQ